MAQTSSLESLITNFVLALESRISAEVDAQVRAAMGTRKPGRPPGRPPGRRPGRPPGSGAKAKPAKAKSAGGGSAARKLQGQYMGALNGLSGAARDRVKKLAADKGKAAAIKLAISLKPKK